MITVSIGGSDRPYLVPNSASITRAKKGRSTASFQLFDASQSYRPVVGSPVVLSDESSSFYGIVSRVRQARVGDDGVMETVRYSVECQDYGALFDRRFVSRRYPSGSIVKNIILDLIAQKWAGEGFDTTNVDGFATIADELVFDYRSGTECLNNISDLSGEDWWMGGSDGKSVYSKAAANAPAAPFVLQDGANFRNLEVEYDSLNYRNRQYVRTGINLESGTITETYTGDGATWLFPTQFVLTAAPSSITVGGVAQAIYELGVDTYPADGWFWIHDGGGIQQGQQTAPGNGVAVVVEYGSYKSTVVMSESVSEQSARAAIEGGSGVWESVEDARDIDNLGAAEALAAGILSRSGSMPTTISYETDYAGITPGMFQRVYLPTDGIEDPVGTPSTGPELITNGDFSSGTGWTLGYHWSIGSGVATATGTGDYIYQDCGIASGKTYAIEFDLTRTAGGVSVILGGSDQTATFSAGGHVSTTLAVNAYSDGAVYVLGESGFQGTIDNLSVKEVTGTDYSVPYYVTQVESKALEVPFEVVDGRTQRKSGSDGWYFRHRVTLSNVRDQGNSLNWWLNFYRQAKSVTDLTNVSGGDTGAVTIDGTPVAYTLP